MAYMQITIGFWGESSDDPINQSRFKVVINHLLDKIDGFVRISHRLVVLR